MVAPVAKACADFAKAWLDEASQVGFSKLPPEVAVRALEDGITSAACDAALVSENDLARRVCWRSPSRRTASTGYLPKLRCLILTISRNEPLDMRLNCMETTELLGDAAPVLRKALENISDSGDVADAVRSALDGDFVVDGVGQLRKIVCPRCLEDLE